MSGFQGSNAGANRLRIKGRKQSVIRFFLISVAYTIVWITLTSELGYYSKLYGPQSLLQLNIAYYLPSIPVLILSGHVESVLDTQFGPTSSMFMRLMFGLLCCAAICVWFPFMPSKLEFLLVTVMVLGTVSGIAFSTSYQLVAWFRSADTIALGLGCVGSGPLALLVQIALQIGPQPEKWQWIALFEIAAAFVVAGNLSALSLFFQYWRTLSGQDHANQVPLLRSGSREDDKPDTPPSGLFVTPRLMSLADPFAGLPWTAGDVALTPSHFVPYPILRRAASLDSEVSFFDSRNTNYRAINKSKSLGAQHIAKLFPPYVSPPVAPRTLPDLSSPEPRPRGAAHTRVGVLLEEHMLTSPRPNGPVGQNGASQSRTPPLPAHAAGPPPPPAMLQLPVPQDPDGDGQVALAPSPPMRNSRSYLEVSLASPVTGLAAAAGVAGPAPVAAPREVHFAEPTRAPGPPSPPEGAAWMAGGGSPASASSPSRSVGTSMSPFASMAAIAYNDPDGGAVQVGSEQGQGEGEDKASEGTQAEEGLLRTTWLVFEDLWPVVVGSLTSSTILNLVFPFFTYVPSSGLLGEMLPQALFYARIFGDIVGRLLPRKKALALSNPYTLLTLAVAQVVVVALFFVYITAPPRVHSDMLSIAIILGLWVSGGYINTNSYILAPSMVVPARCARASALMALTYQIAHFLGLMLAVILALALYGDIAGNL